MRQEEKEEAGSKAEREKRLAATARPHPDPRGQKMRRAVAAAAPTSSARRLAASVRPEEWLGWY